MKFLRLHTAVYSRQEEKFTEGYEIVINADYIISVMVASRGGHAMVQLTDGGTPWTIFESYEAVVGALSQ